MRAALLPSLSSDTITIEMLSHHAGDYYAGMSACFRPTRGCSPNLSSELLPSLTIHVPSLTVAGDPGVMDVYAIGTAGPGLGASLDPANSTGTPRSYLVPGSAKVPNAVGTYMRGASGAGDGVHILTGPVAVAGAVPGDVIQARTGLNLVHFLIRFQCSRVAMQVDILALRPRINPATGKTYGINAAAWWGCARSSLNFGRLPVFDFCASRLIQ